MNASSPLEIPGHVTLVPGNGGLQKACIETRWSTAEIYLHGAHVTRFTNSGQPPVLFLSESSDFKAGAAIRGGIPIIFPWFGARDGQPSHGYARTTEWRLEQTAVLPDGPVRLAFQLPHHEEIFRTELIVTVGQNLTLELLVTNLTDRPADFEACFHTYFHVSAIDQVRVHGLQGAPYHDKVTGTSATEGDQPIRIQGEVDRIYPNTTAAIRIDDAGHGRAIHIQKSRAKSTVVWNPWIKKSARMADIGPADYLHMLCVESGNVADDKITLAPGESTTVAVEIAAEPHP